ncbi:unnamed protein product, partial [Didymodactylos carnosus]
SHANDPAIKLKLIVISIWFISVLLALPEAAYSGTSIKSINSQFFIKGQSVKTKE